jgi:hypothetical protein
MWHCHYKELDKAQCIIIKEEVPGMNGRGKCINLRYKDGAYLACGNNRFWAEVELCL